MKYFLTFLLLGLLSTCSLAQISQYEVFFAQYQNELVIRKWKETGAIKYLVVNPENLKTHILNNIEAQSVTWNNVLNLFEKTPYIHDWQFICLQQGIYYLLFWGMVRCMHRVIAMGKVL